MSAYHLDADEFEAELNKHMELVSPKQTAAEFRESYPEQFEQLRQEYNHDLAGWVVDAKEKKKIAEEQERMTMTSKHNPLRELPLFYDIRLHRHGPDDWTMDVKFSPDLTRPLPAIDPNMVQSFLSIHNARLLTYTLDFQGTGFMHFTIQVPPKSVRRSFMANFLTFVSNTTHHKMVDNREGSHYQILGKSVETGGVLILAAFEDYMDAMTCIAHFFNKQIFDDQPTGRTQYTEVELYAIKPLDSYDYNLPLKQLLRGEKL